MSTPPKARKQRIGLSDTAESPHTWVLVTGDPVAGYAFRGPYPTRSDAEDAQADLAIQLRMDSHLAKLYEP